MSDSLRDRIAAAIYDGMPEWDKKYAIDPRGVVDDLKDHTVVYQMADVVVDLLIDMAGQGELLKAIDRMYR